MGKQVWTKAWSAALLNALGDILAQLVVDKNEKLDYKRLGIFTILVQQSLSSASSALQLLFYLIASISLIDEKHISMCRV